MANVTYDENCLTVLDHPLVGHKMTILRDENTAPAHFRKLVRELAALEAYEATRDLPTTQVQVKTPICETEGVRLKDDALAVVPILRAGMGMLEGVLSVVPSAAVGVLGMERDEETHEPHSYYAKMPQSIENRMALVIDPMLATGGSALAAIKYLREAGVKDIRLLVMVAAPEGVAAVNAAEPDVHIWACALDEGLNDAAYIVPGLGDAGDRIFGTI